MQQKPRERLVETALRLFFRDGFHATGVDRILAEAGVAKMTLYRHFRSKDDLILAAMERYRNEIAGWLDSIFDLAGASSEERILALFDRLHDWYTGRALPGLPFRGCLLVNASIEFAHPSHPVHKAAAAHVASLEGVIDTAVRAAGLSEDLTERLGLVVIGSLVSAQMYRDPQVFDRGKDAARRMLHGTSVPV
ncbi:TetR/AcrR family transcriptional regulator [Pararhodospirillum photometricum]|uniref:TetR/AcrR family transcriptional regulator n=1 Tax=Pararhodospirillum photometricum TaxID=1084 RepID=UPI0002D4C5D0|nr:TetR/AcrR family transcriptional regulator [Pararhodospirillum photometricum]